MLNKNNFFDNFLFDKKKFNKNLQKTKKAFNSFLLDLYYPILEYQIRTCIVEMSLRKNENNLDIRGFRSRLNVLFLV